MKDEFTISWFFKAINESLAVLIKVLFVFKNTTLLHVFIGG